MPEFTSLKQVEAELAKYVPLVKKITGKQVTLERMRPLMKALGNPEKKLKIIHAAGTSGKTSTCYYLAVMLSASGKKTGLTVSPHIDSLTERLQVNGKPVSETEFCKVFGEFMRLVQEVHLEPTYFEILTALAFWYFDKQKVDYAVIETGLGGTHDASNIAQRSDKISVITDIGFDHMHILGSRLEAIAEQKAGIIHRGNEVFMYQQSAEITDVFVRRTKEVGATLNVLSETELRREYTLAGLDELPEFQKRNWLLARHVYQVTATRDNWTPDQSAVKASLEVQVPGRMQVHKVKNQTIIMDGAHNSQKMTAFIKSFKAKYPTKKATILLALKEGKEFKEVLPLLKPVCQKLIITTFDVMQDLPNRSISPELLAGEALKIGIKAVEIEADTSKAWQKLTESGSDISVVTGSFYLLSIVRPLILKA